MSGRELTKRNKPSRKLAKVLYIIALVVALLLTGWAMYRNLAGNSGFLSTVLCLGALAILAAAVIVGNKAGIN